MPWGTIRSANLTSDDYTGLGTWDEADFLARFAAFAPGAEGDRAVENGHLQTNMPWRAYAGMHPEDLRAIWAYLQSLPAISNPVVVFDGPGGPPAIKTDSSDVLPPTKP